MNVSSCGDIARGVTALYSDSRHPDPHAYSLCSHTQQSRVKPNIFLSGSDKETPSGTQPEIFHDFRAPIIQMEGMQRHEKPVIRG